MKKKILFMVIALMTAMAGWAQETENVRIDNGGKRTLNGYKAFYEVEYGFDIDNYEDYYKGDREGGYPHCTNLMLSTSQGYQINNYIYAGGGIGLLRYLDAKETVMPLFLDVRVNFLNDKKVMPFITGRIGGVVGVWGGLYGSIWLGARLKTSSKHAVLFSVGASEHLAEVFVPVDHSGWQALSLGLKLGYEF